MYTLSKSQKPHGCRYIESAIHLLTVILCLMVLLHVVGPKKAFAHTPDFGYDSYQRCYITNISNRILTIHIWKVPALDEFSDYLINPSSMQLIRRLILPARRFSDASYGSWYSPNDTPNTVETRLRKGDYLLSIGYVDDNKKLDWWKTRFAIGEDTGLPVEIYISEFCVRVGKICCFHPIIPIERRGNTCTGP